MLSEFNLKAAKAKGRLSGNPGLRARHPVAIPKAAQARNRVFTGDVIASMNRWLPTVRHMRPQYPWEDPVRMFNQADGVRWTTERLRRAVRRGCEGARTRQAAGEDPAQTT